MTDVSFSKPPRSQWLNVWDQFKTHRGAYWGMCFFVFVCLAVVFGPYIHTVDPSYIDIRAKNQGMSFAHPMGTDQLGRDMFAQVLAGGRVSLLVGVTAMALAMLLGTLIGVLAGYFKWLDGPLMRFTDLFLALPLLPLLLNRRAGVVHGRRGLLVLVLLHVLRRCMLLLLLLLLLGASAGPAVGRSGARQRRR